MTNFLSNSEIEYVSDSDYFTDFFDEEFLSNDDESEDEEFAGQSTSSTDSVKQKEDESICISTSSSSSKAFENSSVHYSSSPNSKTTKKINPVERLRLLVMAAQNASNPSELESLLKNQYDAKTRLVAKVNFLEHNSNNKIYMTELEYRYYSSKSITKPLKKRLDRCIKNGWLLF